MIVKIGLSLLLIGVGAVNAATPNLAKNGSFEVKAPASGCASATTSMYGWNIVAGNIDIDSELCSTIPADQGNFWVDLTGTGSPGTIERNLLTTVGKNYNLSFSFGGNPQCQGGGDDTPVKAMNVLLNGVVVGTYSINVTGAATNDPQWQKGAIIFAATTSPTVLAFQSLNGTGVTSPTVCGPLLDNVRVVLVP